VVGQEEAVKRYEFDPVFKEDYEDEEGEWMLYADHLADREALLTLLQRAVECIRHLRHGVRDVPAEEAVLAACREKLDGTRETDKEGV
jgi:hypothetical protein